VETVLGETGTDPKAPCLEITEPALMSDSPSVTTALSALSGLGVGLAIDDFGTGYSSLGYIRRFPVSWLKVHALFVQGLGRRADDAAIVAAVAGMGKALGLGVVAEGVERREQLEALRALGCECAQGYYFARPQPTDAIDAVLCGAGGR
jgi:EAL domain-containing protein (putative c-di-GMP-specific phosphodiesterase class I)